MADFTWGGWRMGVNLGALLEEAKVHAREANFEHLGDSVDEQRALLATFVSRCVADVLDQAVSLGKANAQIAVTAGTQAIALPEDLRSRDVRNVTFRDNAGRITPLPFIGRATADGLETLFQRMMDRPERFSFSEDGAQLLLWPVPNVDGTVRVTYRPEAAPITAEQIAQPGAVTIGEIPTRFQEALALHLAAMIVSPIKPDLGAALMLRYQSPDPRTPGALDRLLKELLRSLAILRGGKSHQDGLINTRAFFGGLTRF